MEEGCKHPASTQDRGSFPHQLGGTEGATEESREIAALELQDVAEDGSWVGVRPKTSAATWRRMEKRVDNAPGLPARELVRFYRQDAAKHKRSLLWEDEGSGGYAQHKQYQSHLRVLLRPWV